MTPVYVPSTGPETWRRLLASATHWKPGHSAHALAHRWELADGFPPEVRKLFEATERFRGLEPLLAIPEHRVPLPGGRRASQIDVWVLARSGRGLVSIAVEGKAQETFGPALAGWNATSSTGKTERLRALREILGLPDELPGDLRYQLLHRTAAAILEARRFDAPDAVMLVHAFGPNDASRRDFERFVALLGAEARSDTLIDVGARGGVELHVGWATGDARAVPPAPVQKGDPGVALRGRFEAAVAYALALHSRHARKGTRIPYASHLLAVAALVLEDGGDEDEAIAALLHDAIEDQRAKEAEIRERFGDRVAAIVAACTDNSGEPEPPWRERKERYLAHIATASADARRVSCADKVHNARCILRDHRDHGEAVWERFNAGPEEVLWYYRSLVEAFGTAGGGPLVEELGRAVGELEREVMQVAQARGRG